MAKVIVERPRVKSWVGRKPKGRQRRLMSYGEDGPPAREGIRARWQGHTNRFNEHLGPLRRYLDSQVGRPWDKVYSEICAHINRDSVVQDHVRDHVDEYVTVHVLLIDGVPCTGEGGRTYGQPLHTVPGRRPWYVCPRTGLLRRVEALPRKQPRYPRPKPKPRYVPVSDTLQCRYFDRAWHLITLQPLPTPYSQKERCRAVDVLLNRPVAGISQLEAERQYGAAVYAVAKRRLGRRELAQFPIPMDLWT